MAIDFNEYVHYRALALKYNTRMGDHLQNQIDHLIEAGSEVVPPVKNVCAKLSVELSDQLDHVSGLLGISKRKFIEMALIQALDHAEHVIECVGALEDGDAEASDE